MEALVPLFLDGRNAQLHVGLLEKALLIRTEATADALCPLRRLDRVQCWGEVWWSSDALAACGMTGVTVAFHRGYDICAVTAPCSPRVRAFGAILEAAIKNDRCDAALKDWSAHQASRSRIDAVRREPRLAGAERSPGLRNAERRVRSLRDVWLRQQLATTGAPAAFMGPSSARPNVARIFREALDCDVAPLILRLASYEDHPRAGKAEAVCLRRAAQWFEGEKPALMQRFRRAWRSFDRLMRDLAEGADLWVG